MSEEQRFVDNEDGTISDNHTNLMWMKNDSYIELKRFLHYVPAKKFMERMNRDTFAGYSDWRIPSKKEAQSLFYYDKSKSIKDKFDMVLYIDPVFPTGGGYNTWTSETRGKITAFVFGFADGSGQHQEVDGTISTSVRLVRGEPNPDALAQLGKILAPKGVSAIGGAGWR